MKKGKLKRALSGIMAAFTLLTTVISPMTVYAEDSAETPKPPAYEDIKEQLDPDEVVKGKDFELDFGTAFDVKNNFKELDIKDKTKVKITLFEAKDSAGQDFSTDRAGTYKTVYYVAPVSEHPIYRISRNITVKEQQTEAVTEVLTETAPETESQSAAQSDSSSEEDSADDSDSDPETEQITEAATIQETERVTEVLENVSSESEEVVSFTETEEINVPETEPSEEISEAVSSETEMTDIEIVDTELTTDSDTEIEEAGLDLMALDEGETVSIEAEASLMTLAASAKATQSVDVTRGSWYFYNNYGLGSYQTAPYKVKFGNVSATAYCIQPSKEGPGDGKYTITKLSDGKALAKVCYYGTKASGDEGFFAEKYPDFSTGKRFVITHLAASYANGSSDAFSGANATGKKLAMELYDYCMAQPDIPDVDMSFSDNNVTGYVEGNILRTKVVTFQADELQKITMKLPAGVQFHNETTGKVSAAGASVEICGGTKFYLTAPLTQAQDASLTWSATMAGSVTKDFSAYKITVGGGKQDLALVFGEAVGDEKYVSFSVTWVDMASISIVKSDKSTSEKLAGAVYGIYSDPDCQNLIVQMPATDASGVSSVSILKTQETVYLKEITVPNGYVIDSTAYNIKLESYNTTTVNVQDNEQLANLRIFKTGEMLTGAETTDSGVRFIYTEQKLAGAEFQIYAAENITTPTGRVIYEKGAPVGSKLTTGADGSVAINGLHLGSYTVTEVGAPKGYVKTGESKTVTLSYAGATVETVFSEVSIHNDRKKASVSVKKQDKTTKNPLAGAIFGLYAESAIQDASGKVIMNAGTLIEQIQTGTDGTAVFQADLPIGYSYSMKELKAPSGYLKNTTDSYTFSFNDNDAATATAAFSHAFDDELVKAEIHLIKKDSETNTAQGDASLKGAVYGLYAKKDIVHPDQKTGVLYKADAKIAEMTTDENGKASVKNLFLGEYYVKELTASEGYLVDNTPHDVICSYEGEDVATVTREVTSPEDVKKQPFQVIKAADNGKTDADLLKGAGFSAWLVSSLKIEDDGSYDFTSAEPVVITADGKCEMFTDERGYAVSIPLPYGKYVVKETTTPHNYDPVNDFYVTISENHPNTPQVWRILLDKEFEAKLKIIKKDDETKRSVLSAGTEFKIFDLDNSKYVEQVTTYPVVTTHKSYFTDAQGYLILPNNLNIGHYRIEEITAPEGYTQNTDYINITVDSNTAYLQDSVSGDTIIEAVYENHPVKGQLSVYKKGEVLTAFDGKDFIYEEKYLADAVYDVYAAENIYTADFQKDESGNRLLEYAEGDLVTTITTNTDGLAIAKDLPLGTYLVKEKNAPEGFTLNAVPQEVSFEYADQNTAVIQESLTFSNERQKVSLTVEKQDDKNQSVVTGAVFGLYPSQDIENVTGDIIVKADTLLQEMTTDEKGLALFTLDLPLGQYYVKELNAPAGYISTEEILSFDAGYQGQDVPVAELHGIMQNEPTTVELTKTDATTCEEVDGATLTVLNQEGTVIDTWTSVKGEPHYIQRLTAGETYTLREEFAPYGYLRAEEVEFTVEDSGEIQKVEMKDAVPKALLIINKKGEFLEDITLVNQTKGIVEHIFEYLSGSLTEVTFEVYAAEDIKAADGVSEDCYKKDDLVATITTDDQGIAKAEDLPVGKYYVIEAATAHGYVLDCEPRYVDLTYRDQDTPIVTYDEDWQNIRQKVSLNLLKKEKDSDRVLAGAIFGLYAAEDIKSASGKVLMEKDDLIEQKSTDEKGELKFKADLPIDCHYYIKEILAPDGFVNSEEVQEFTFDASEEKIPEVVFHFVFENEPTIVEITKADIATCEEIPGAHLKVTDKDGNVVDEWTSTKKPHAIKELTVGKTYTLTETKPADGYVTAESIQFVIENTAEVQKHEMLDDVTKVKISKTDITGDQEIPGAKLTVLDQNDQVVESWVSESTPHYIEKLPIGSYTLREEQAPKGYILTEDASFEVKDTGEIQMVKMKNATAKGKLILNKTDADNEEPLKGIEYEIRDASGTTVEKLVTDAAGHAESSLLEIASFKDGTYSESMKYVLVETKTLDGYTLDSTKYEIIFDYVNQNTPIIEVTKNLTNKKSPVPEPPKETPGTSVTNVPKTGDTTNILFPVIMLFISLGALGYYAGRKIRKKSTK